MSISTSLWEQCIYDVSNFRVKIIFCNIDLQAPHLFYRVYMQI